MRAGIEHVIRRACVLGHRPAKIKDLYFVFLENLVFPT